MRLKARIEKLEAKLVGGYVGYRMRDGSTKYIASRLLLDAFNDVVYGRPTPAAEVLRMADPTVPGSDGNRMHELAQSLRAPPYVPGSQQKTEDQAE
jgi:hypothetical protein